MNNPESAPGPGTYEDKEKIKERVGALWHKATDEYYQALAAANKIGDVRPLSAMLEKHREEVIRQVSESLSKTQKQFLTDENIISYLINEIQYNKTTAQEIEYILKRY